MPDYNAPLYRSRIRTSIHGARLGLDDDGALVGPIALKKDVRSLTTVSNTGVASHGISRITATGSSQGPVQHYLSAPIPGVELMLTLTSSSTGSHQFLSTAAGAAIEASSLGTTVGVINFIGPGGSITLVGLTTALWAIRSRDDLTSTALGRSITFTTST